MACNYMAKEMSWNPEYYEIESDSNTFKIWFYDLIVDDESGHGVTRGRFEINRKTAFGIDGITFEEIDFKEYLE